MRATIYPIQSGGPYRLAIVARPRGGDWLIDELAAFSREGVDVLVSMLVPEEAQELGLQREEEECAAAAVTFVSVPISDRSIPIDRNDFLRGVDQVAELIREGHSVGVHCRASIGRVSVFAVSVLVRLGCEAGKAFDAVESARGCSIPDTPEQRRWVIDNVVGRGINPDELTY
jgi:protein-tyrosine phosphatase